MKLLDRYVLLAFVRNYLVSLLVLVGMWITLDMVFNFDELVEVKNRTGDEAGSTADVLKLVGRYYFHQSFLIFKQLSGIIPVAAAAFTIVRLSRNNEMTAMLAAGVPLLRVAAPIIIAAVVLNALVVIDQEVVIPSLASELSRSRDEVYEGASAAYEIAPLQGPDGTRLLVGSYDPGSTDTPPRASVFDVIEYDDEDLPQTSVSADYAIWDPARQHWRLETGRRRTGLSGQTPGQVIPVASYPGTITPDDIALARSGDIAELLPTIRIQQLLSRPDVPGRAELLKVLHSRFAMPVLNIIVLLLAVATLINRDRFAFKWSIMLMLMLVGGCLGMVFATQSVAGQNPLGPQAEDYWPAILAWMPILVFGPVTVWLLDRVNRFRS